MLFEYYTSRGYTRERRLFLSAHLKERLLFESGGVLKIKVGGELEVLNQLYSSGKLTFCRKSRRQLYCNKNKGAKVRGKQKENGRVSIIWVWPPSAEPAKSIRERQQSRRSSSIDQVWCKTYLSRSTLSFYLQWRYYDKVAHLSPRARHVSYITQFGVYACYH